MIDKLEQEKKDLVAKYNRAKTKQTKYKLSKAIQQLERAIYENKK